MKTFFFHFFFLPDFRKFFLLYPNYGWCSFNIYGFNNGQDLYGYLSGPSKQIFLIDIIGFESITSPSR